jgi:hypothetical protein
MKEFQEELDQEMEDYLSLESEGDATGYRGPSYMLPENMPTETNDEPVVEQPTQEGRQRYFRRRNRNVVSQSTNQSAP